MSNLPDILLNWLPFFMSRLFKKGTFFNFFKKEIMTFQIKILDISKGGLITGKVACLKIYENSRFRNIKNVCFRSTAITTLFSSDFDFPESDTTDANTIQ